MSKQISPDVDVIEIEPPEIVGPEWHPATGVADVSDRELTLEALGNLALENNPSLRQAGAIVSQSKGQWQQVGLYPNPVVGYEGEEIGDDDTAGRQGGFVSQTIVTADKLKLNRNVAAWDVQQARWQAEAQRRAVLNSVRIQFYRVLAAQKSIEVAEELEAILREGMETAQTLRRAGQAPQTDVLQAEIELETVRLTLRNARRREDAARRQLAALVGLPRLAAGRLVGVLDGEVRPRDQDMELMHLLAESPVMEAAHARVERARAQLRREQVQPIPDVDVEGGVSHDYVGEQTLYTVRVGMMLPTHNRNQGNIAAASAAVHAAVENVNRLKFALQQRLAEVYRRYEMAESQVTLYRESLLPKSEQTLELTTRGYSAGEVDFLRVLTARRTFVENRLTYIEVLADLQTAVAELDGLLITGGLNNPSQALQQVSGNVGQSGGATPALTKTPRTFQ